MSNRTPFISDEVLERAWASFHQASSALDTSLFRHLDEATYARLYFDSHSLHLLRLPVMFDSHLIMAYLYEEPT